MDRKCALDEDVGDRGYPGPGDRDAVRLARRVNAIFDLRSISREDRDKDSYTGDESVEDYLQRRKRI